MPSSITRRRVLSSCHPRAYVYNLRGCQRLRVQAVTHLHLHTLSSTITTPHRTVQHDHGDGTLNKTPGAYRQYLSASTHPAPPPEAFADMSMLLPSAWHPSAGESVLGAPLKSKESSFLSLISTEEKEQLIRANKDGIIGDVPEVLAVLDTCLQVGKIQRAEVILNRLAGSDILDASQMMEWSDRYLKACLEAITTSGDQSLVTKAHQWFDMEVRRFAIQPNLETIAYMLQISLRMAPLEDRQKHVQLYLKHLPTGVSAQQLKEAGILDTEELRSLEALSAGALPANDVQEIQPANASAAPALVTEDTSKPPAAVLPVPQKGGGLRSVQSSLVSLVGNGDIPKPTASDDLRVLQERLEVDAVASAMQRWREENDKLRKIGVESQLRSKSMGTILWRWHEHLEKAIREEIKLCDKAEKVGSKKGHDLDRCQYGPFLRKLSVEKMSAVTILCFMGLSGHTGSEKGMVLSSVITRIAEGIQDEALVQARFKDYVKTKRAASRKARTSFGPSKQNQIARSPAVMSRFRGDSERWPSTIGVKLGACLLSALIKVAKIHVELDGPQAHTTYSQMQPAFYHDFVFKQGKKIGVVKINPHVFGILRREPLQTVIAKQLPMITEPEPWTGFNKGGYISHPSVAIRIKPYAVEQKLYGEAAVARGDMKEIFAGLDVLGRTGWRINRPVLDVMLAAWNSGEPLANLAPADPNLPLPPEPSQEDATSARRKWLAAVKTVENTRAGYHSQRCFQNFQLEIARALVNVSFYFPHNVDFRGRAYPIPPYFNHMGADNCRGLLTFSEGRQLGQMGLRWLKVHLANVHGYDKASFADREAFAMENMDEIIDSATNPMTGRRWWLRAEDPWQCLAACMELKAALAAPDPSAFVSHLPVHQDGTCNGLQHYAALGGDEWGAQQVNLEPGDRPADVYAAVAELVHKDVEMDLAHGNPLAKVVSGKITRKVVKQTVMTNVYGVTFVGAKEQIKRQLKALWPELCQGQSSSSIDHERVSRYLAKKVFTALSTMFQGAHEIQFWLGRCAARICNSVSTQQLDKVDALVNASQDSAEPAEKKRKGCTFESEIQSRASVIWTSPLKMPVVQPYRRSKSKMVSTLMQKIVLKEPSWADSVCQRKQLQAFPPNFIHSLDATHMILSALACEKAGLTFAAVHDSFWTHAASVDKMNIVLRDEFIRLHSEDVVGRLASEFNARYKDSMYLARIDCKSAAGQEVLRIRTALNRTHHSRKERRSATKQRAFELSTERLRLRLLSSTDPAEVEKGKTMVTPASVLEKGLDTSVLPEKDSKLGASAIEYSDASPAAKLVEHEKMLEGDSAARTIDGMVDVDNAEKDAVKDIINSIGIEDDLPIDLADGQHDNLLSEISEQTTSFDRSLKGQKDQKKTPKSTWVWLPWTLPPIPQKGAFDVERLRKSPYFFS